MAFSSTRVLLSLVAAVAGAVCGDGIVSPLHRPSLKLRWTEHPVRRMAARRAAAGSFAALTQFAQFLDDLIERRLSQALDRLDDCDFEMKLLVRRPLHSAFGAAN